MGSQIDRAAMVGQVRSVLTTVHPETDLGPVTRNQETDTALGARNPEITRGPALQREAAQAGSRILDGRGTPEAVRATTVEDGRVAAMCDTMTGGKVAESGGMTGIVVNVSTTAGTVCMPRHAATSGVRLTEISSSPLLPQA